jgi:hypothetical protein
MKLIGELNDCIKHGISKKVRKGYRVVNLTNINPKVYHTNSDLFSGRGESPHRRYLRYTEEPASALCIAKRSAELVRNQCRRYSPDERG